MVRWGTHGAGEGAGGGVGEACASLPSSPTVDEGGEAWLVRNVVKLLRRKLGDDADSPRHIITEPRVGHRMATGEEQW